MNSLFDNERNLHEYDVAPEPDREISLGTSTILGIFFALALVCAVFFGFGYTMGRRSAQTSAQTIPPVTATPASASQTTTSKPSSTSQSDSTPDESVATKTSAIVSDPEPLTKTQTPPPVVAPPAKPSARTLATVAPPASKSIIAKPTITTAPPPAAAPAASAGTMVQIAAVSHREDADILIQALQRRGYDVAIHQTPQDKLLHVQIGPFANRKEADTMRQRLLADGYNAIVK